MFNLTSPTNIRCNGVVKNMPASISRLQRSQISRLGNEKSKYVDEIEGSGMIPSPPLSIKKESLDDPYTFSDSEIHLTSSPDIKYHVNETNNSKNVLNIIYNNIKTSDRHEKMIKLPPKNKVTLRTETNNVKESEYKSSIIDVSESTTRAIKATGGAGIATPPTKPVPTNLKTRRINLKATHHEALQRIRDKRDKKVWHAPYVFHSVKDDINLSDTDSDEELISRNVLNYQEFLLDCCMDDVGTSEREMIIQKNRESLQRVLQQKQQQFNHTISSCFRTINLISALKGKQCNQLANIILQQNSNVKKSHLFRSTSSGIIPPRQCSYKGETGACKEIAVPCTRHCSRHIMDNSDQLLYDYCTAKFADNTQCCIPVFDLNHELPLCIEHARKRDNYNKMCQVIKPKKARKKVKPSAMIRPQKRSKKWKRLPARVNIKNNIKTTDNFTDTSVADNSSACDSSDDLGLGTMPENSENHYDGDEPDADMVAQVLGVTEEELPLVLANPAETLVNTASRLLEETDLTTVFSQIPPDAFNDLFAIDRNGVYEPTREETEELERALEAVNQDVKSLEKMSQTQGILDTLLDEHALVESLAQMPDVFPNLNGFSTVSGSSPSVTQAVPNRPIHALDNIITIQPSANMSS